MSMKNILFVLIGFSFATCTEKKWSKKLLVKQCIEVHQLEYANEKIFTKEQVQQLCDCVAGKMIVKYKSEAETNGDSFGAKKIAQDCKMEVMPK